MPKVVSIIAVLLFLAMTGHAQNWKTVRMNDTTYFRGGLHESSVDIYTPYNTFSPVLKTIFVDAINNNGSDTTYHFFKSVRTPGENVCIDTTAPSWMGRYFVRTANGTEYYFNSFDDTITINTLASTGDSWTLAKDNTNLTFIGTVIAAGQTTVEGVSDSFKRISIQAYQSGNPVANPYNNKVLEWSKDHGWLKTLDMYRFPNQENGWEEFGAVTDSVQMLRLDNDFAHLDLNYIDLQWKYAPGNEWIKYHCWGGTAFGTLPYNGCNKTITHDSVINSFLINPQTIVAELQTKTYSVSNFTYLTTPPYNWDSVVVTSITFHNDTITNTPGNTMVGFINPEVADSSMTFMLDLNADHDIMHKYFIDTLCSKPLIGKAMNILHYIGDVNGCWEVGQSVSGGMTESGSTLYGFGDIKSIRIIADATFTSPTWYNKKYYRYLKLPDCTIGDKIDVIALNTKNIAGTQNKTFIYPSPAHSYVIVNSSVLNKEASISLVDITGKELLHIYGLQASNKLQLNNIPPGIYFIKIASNTIRETHKIVVE